VFNYSVKIHHIVTIVLEEVSLKPEVKPVPETWCILFQYIRWRKSKKSMSLNIMHQNRPVGFPIAATWISLTGVFRTLPLVLNIPVMVSKNLLRMYLDGPHVAFYWRQKEDDEHLTPFHVLPLPTLRSGHWRKGYLKWLGWYQYTVHCKFRRTDTQPWMVLLKFDIKFSFLYSSLPFLIYALFFSLLVVKPRFVKTRFPWCFRLLNIHLLS
jgi:hypothetical protein